MAEEQASTQETEATSTEPNVPSELDKAKAENTRLKLEWEQAQHVNQKQRKENDQYRHQVEQYRANLQSQGIEEPQQSQENVLQQQLDSQSEEIGLMRYKLENPQWQDTWSEVQQLLNDPVKVEEIAVFDRQGKPDMRKSLVNAQTRIEIEQLRKLKSETEAAKATKATEQERLKGQATISGVPASVGEEEVNVDDMSSDDMIRAGLVDMDPRDPAKERRPKE